MVPIGELVGAPSEAFRTPPEAPRTCAACGSYHGGVNAGLLCLERALRLQRAEIRRLVNRVLELEGVAK
jgi:uncharacterized protein YbcC (UPF0753/DUF2309 family)